MVLEVVAVGEMIDEVVAVGVAVAAVGEGAEVEEDQPLMRVLDDASCSPSCTVDAGAGAGAAFAAVDGQ